MRVAVGMRVSLVVVSPTVEGYIKEGEEDYAKRLKRLCTLQREEVRVRKEWGKLGGEEQREREAPLVLSALEGKRNVWLLDEGGVMMTSVEFSQMLSHAGTHGGGEITFAIGGAYGFGGAVLSRYGAQRLSLSKMTFTHQMVRLIFLEQLYRGFMIQRGSHYHHE